VVFKPAAPAEAAAVIASVAVDTPSSTLRRRATIAGLAA
jgi:hypothetical protein